MKGVKSALKQHSKVAQLDLLEDSDRFDAVLICVLGWCCEDVRKHLFVFVDWHCKWAVFMLFYKCNGFL